MNSINPNLRARLRLPGTAAPDKPSHDHLMPPPKPLRRFLTGLAAALTMGLFTTPASAQQMISNGSFEVGATITDGNITAVDLSSGPSNTDLPGWSGNFTYWYMNHWNGYTAENGTRYVNLVYPTGANALFQTLDVSAGATYTVSYYNLRRGGGGQAIASLSVSGGTVTGADLYGTAITQPTSSSIQQVTTADSAWTQYGFTFTPDTTGTATLTLDNYCDGATYGDNDGVFLDNVSVLGPAALTTTTTTLTLGAGSNPSSYGDSLGFHVTVDPGTASGTVELFDGGASGTLIGTGELVGGACTITNTTLAVGTHDNIVAIYNGDTFNNPSTSAALIPAQVVNAGPAAKLLVTTPPSDAQPGEVWATQPTVKVLDAGGNIADSSASITLAITTSTPASGGPGTLIGTKTVTAVHGVATFSGLKIDTAGVGYRLTATSTDLTPADSALFTVSSGTVLYDSTACSGQFPRTTLDFTPAAGHVYTLSFSLNNPANSLCNCLIGFSPDNAYNGSTLIDGFWVSGTWVGNGSVRRNYNGGIVESSFTTAGSGNGYWGPVGELDSNFEVVLDTTGATWKTSTSMSSGLGTLSGSVLDAGGTPTSVQVWVRDPGNNFFPTISNFRLTDTSFVVNTPYDAWANRTFANGTLTDKTPTGDPDGDGMTNFQEFAFGLDPTTGASCNPITQQLDPATGIFKYTRYADSGLAYTVESSTDLAGWAPATTLESIGDPDANGVQTVTVTVSDSPLNGKLFVRVRAE